MSKDQLLGSAKIIGFLITKDYEKARAFFEGILGLRFVSHDEYALVFRAGENIVRIVKVPSFTPVTSTALGWEVRNIEAVVASLKERGVSFENYPFIQDRELGIWTTPNGDKVAWFKDPDGNVLSVSEHA